MNFFSINAIEEGGELIHNDKYIHHKLEYELDYWNKYTNELGQIIYILGRPVVDVEKWNDFDNKASFISKILLNEYNSKNIDNFCNDLNGAFSIIIFDKKINNLVIITDKLGIFPLYGFEIDSIDKFHISSNLNLIKDSVDNKLTKDKISIAEFIKKGFIYHPNTLYNEIKTLNNASYYIYDLEKEAVNKKVYFKIKENSEDNFDYLVDQLSVALKNAIKRRTTKYYKKKVVFLSGGSDSRTILNNSYDNIEAITLYYKYNYEIEISERLTKTLNKKHNLIKRSENYYFDAFDKSIELNGGRSLPTDDHFINIAKHASILQYDSILTGCYADWMFKGIALDRAKISLFGKLKLPLYKLITFNYDFFSKRTKVNEKYEKLIKAREDKIFKNKGDLFDNEVNRIFPLFQEETSSTRLTLQQLFPWDTIFSDNDIINIYMQIPVKYKINSEVYDAAVAKLTKNIDYIPHANKRHKIGLNKYLGALLYLKSIVVNKIKRIFGMLKKDSLAGEGSWISFQEYSRNEKIINLWNEVKKDESLYGDILDNKDMDIDSIRKYDYKLIYKIITISKIFSQIKK